MSARKPAYPSSPGLSTLTRYGLADANTAAASSVFPPEQAWYSTSMGKPPLVSSKPSVARTARSMRARRTTYSLPQRACSCASVWYA